jgi:hypothetical protein
MVLNPNQDRGGQAQNFLNFSRGEIADKSSATLFKAAGDTLDASIKIADQQVVNSIRNEATEDVDAIRDVANGTATAQDVTETELPDDAKAEIKNAQRKSQARKQGKLSDTHYWSQMDSVSRKLRSRYPGHRAQIDSIMSGLVGRTPANALRSALQAEANRSQNKAEREQSQRERWVAQGLVSPDVIANPSKYTQAEVAAQAGARNRLKADIQLKRAQMALATDRRQFDDDTAQRNLRAELATENALVVNDVATKDIMDRIRDFQQRGDNVAPEEIKSLLANIGELQTIAQRRALKVATDTDSNGFSYTARLGPKASEEALSSTNAVFNTITNAVANKQWGLLGFKLQSLQQIEQSDNLEAGKQGFFRVQKVLREVSPALQEAWLATPEGLRQVTNLSNHTAVLSAHKIMTSQQTLAAEVKSLSAEGASATTISRSIDNLETALFDDTVTDDQFATTVENMFGPGNENFLTRDIAKKDREKLFTQFASPRMLKRFQNKLQQGFTKEWELYKSWVLNNFNGITGQDMAELDALVVNRKDFTASFNPKTSQIDIKPRTLPNVQAGLGVAGQVITGVRERSLMGSAEEAVRRINRYMSVTKPLFEAEGTDPNAELLRLLNANGVDFNAKGQGPEVGSILTTISNVITKKLGLKGNIAEQLGLNPTATVEEVRDALQAAQDLRE